MKRETLSPSTLHAPFSTYVHGIAVDAAKRVIFSAGQVCGDKDGNIVGVGDFDAQGEQVMKNLADVLAEGGATFSDIVKVTTLCGRPAIRPTGPRPVRATLGQSQSAGQYPHRLRRSRQSGFFDRNRSHRHYVRTEISYHFTIRNYPG